MNNAGTVLLTVADMSIIEAEIEVDETDIPFVQLGQPAKITIDAIADKTFTGKVTEIGNSPIQTTGTGTTARTATNFKVTVTIRTRFPTCAPASPAPRRSRPRRGSNVIAVPIQAMTVRELLYDAAGQHHSGDAAARSRASSSGAPGRRPPPRRRRELQPGQKREGNRRRLRDPRRQGDLRAGQDRHRRRALSRSDDGPQGRRPRHHRAVRVGAWHVRGRSREHAQAGTAT